MSTKLIKVKHDWKSFAMGMVVISVFEILILFWADRNIAYLLFGLAVLPLVPLWCILVIKFIDWVTPLALEEGGIRCYTGLGIRTSVRWKDVKATKSLVFWPGLKWIIFDDGRRFFTRACLPIFVQNRASFLHEVAKSAGDDHIVVRVLRENGFGKT